MDSFLVRQRRKKFRVGFVVKGMVMVIYFGNAPFPPFCMLGNSLSFFLLCPWTVAIGPDVFCGMAGCLVIVSLVKGTTWAASFEQLASRELERCFGAYPVDSSRFWVPPGFWDADDLALQMTDTPNIWIDGSREDSPVGGFEVACAGVYLPATEEAMRGSVWSVAEEYGDAGLERCRAFMPVPGPLQSVQRAEFWGAAIIALQTYWPCHLGVDNLNVARSGGRLLDHGCLAKPLPLVKDGDLVAIAQYMIQVRGQDTVRVTKVTWHATEMVVQQGRVREEDRLGNAEADTAADLGRRHQSELVMNVGRALHNARDHWYPFILQLHRFMVAVSRVAVRTMKRSFLKPQAPSENVFVGDGRQRPPSKVSFSQVSSGAKSAPFQVPTVQACSGVLDSGTSRSDAEALIADDPELQKRIRMLEACLRVHSLSGPGLEGSLDSVTKVMVPPPVRRAPISVENTLTENMITVLGDDGDVPVVSRSSLRLADRRRIGTGSRAVCGGRPVCTDPPSASPGHVSGSVARHGGCEPDAADCVADGGAGESVGRRAVRAGKAGCSFFSGLSCFWKSCRTHAP